MTRHLRIVLLILMCCTQSFAKSPDIICADALTASSISEEIKSILDSGEQLRALSKGGVIFSVYGKQDSGFPFDQFAKETRFAIQEITHGGWGWSRLYRGSLQRAGSQYLYLNVGDQVKRIDIKDIASVAVLPVGNASTNYVSEEIKSSLDSVEQFRALSKTGVIFSVYGKQDSEFPFDQFSKGTRFAIQEITHGGWGWSRLYRGSLQRAGSQYLYLNVGDQVKRIDIKDIAGVALLSPL